MNSHDHATRDLLACMGDASRFRLVKALADGSRCVSELARAVGLSQSCTTRHLQALERGRLVSRARDGKRVMYRLSGDEPALSLLAWALGQGAMPAGADRGEIAGGGSVHRDRPRSMTSVAGARAAADAARAGRGGAAAPRVGRNPGRPTARRASHAGPGSPQAGAGDPVSEPLHQTGDRTSAVPSEPSAAATGGAGTPSAADPARTPPAAWHEIEDYLL